MYRHHRQ
ncbi:hypothetical protein YPPY96_1881, partial [Yersinia pestis PY-96]